MKLFFALSLLAVFTTSVFADDTVKVTSPRGSSYFVSTTGLGTLLIETAGSGEFVGTVRDNGEEGYDKKDKKNVFKKIKEHENSEPR